MPDIKLLDDRWECRSCCKNSFRIFLLRILPLLSASTGVIVISIGCSDRFGSEHLRVVGVSMISCSLFWFVWGNFIDFCVNGYGKNTRHRNRSDACSSATRQTKVWYWGIRHGQCERTGSENKGTIEFNTYTLFLSGCIHVVFANGKKHESNNLKEDVIGSVLFIPAGDLALPV